MPLLRDSALLFAESVLLQYLNMEKPELILLDEPTNALDQESVSNVKKILYEENQRGATIVIASHIDEDVRDLCLETVSIDCGRLVQVEQD